jgi:hypothetical protein
VTIARKVETTIFRGVDVDKGKVDVNVAEGVVWLRGEVRTPELIKQLEERAAKVAEVRGVENLLHLPKTPAPSRTDTPAPQRKTRRSSKRPEERTVNLTQVTEEAPAPPSAEPSPREVAASGTGRRPAPLGSQDTEEAAAKPAGEAAAEPAAKPAAAPVAKSAAAPTAKPAAAPTAKPAAAPTAKPAAAPTAKPAAAPAAKPASEPAAKPAGDEQGPEAGDSDKPPASQQPRDPAKPGPKES